MAIERIARAAFVLALCLAAACATRRGPVHEELRSAAERNDALATADALEALIAQGADTPADREFAYDAVRAREEDTAAYAFARATVTGRLVQQRGLLGGNLVADIERWALRSRELDPDFRDGAATRLLGTLYVLAPAALLEHGDSEHGLALLEEIQQRHPNSLENHLRLAEAYISLGDPAPAEPHLCACIVGRASLRRDDQQLLDQLLATAGTPTCVSQRAPRPARSRAREVGLVERSDFRRGLRGDS